MDFAAQCFQNYAELDDSTHWILDVLPSMELSDDDILVWASESFHPKADHLHLVPILRDGFWGLLAILYQSIERTTYVPTSPSPEAANL